MKLAERVRTGSALPERLSLKRLEFENRIKKQQEEKYSKETVGCTFHPVINAGGEDSRGLLFYASVGRYGQEIYPSCIDESPETPLD